LWRYWWQHGITVFWRYCDVIGDSTALLCSGVIGDSTALLSVAAAQSRGCVLVGIAVSAFAGEVCADGSTVLLRSSSVSCRSPTCSSHFFSVIKGASYFLLVSFLSVCCWNCNKIYANAVIKVVSVVGLPTLFEVILSRRYNPLMPALFL